MFTNSRENGGDSNPEEVSNESEREETQENSDNESSESATKVSTPSVIGANPNR
jgi:hypothetical protein